VIAERARLVNAAYLLADVGATIAALGTAYLGRTLITEGRVPWFTQPLPPFEWYLPLVALIVVIWPLVFYAMGLYGRQGRTLSTETSALVTGIGVAGLLLMALIFGAKLTYISRPVILVFLVVNVAYVAAGRRLVRGLLLDGRVRRPVIVAGDEAEVARAAAAVDAHRDWGLEVVGLATDGRWTETTRSPHPVLGTYADIPRVVQEQHAAEVIIAPALDHLDELRQIGGVISALEAQGTMVRLAVNFLPRSIARLSFDELGEDLPLLTFSTTPGNEVRLAVRRVVDVTLALALIVLLSPLLLLIAVGIKIASPGPVLFRQPRCGLYGRRFTFLKFRTMRPGSDALKAQLQPFNEMDGPAFKMTNDPRVFPLGGLLRRTSLDELPQLWNILLGDMSFVGPRPSVVEEVEQYQPWQRRRLSMKPGLTCLWQVSGRNELTFDEWMKLDLEYIDNWSLWLDIKIALKTIPAVLLGRGAK
jgi:exopolysaccharide biosynthesis polyprenyl glycosylphosphotransferase